MAVIADWCYRGLGHVRIPDDRMAVRESDAETFEEAMKDDRVNLRSIPFKLRRKRRRIDGIEHEDMLF